MAGKVPIQLRDRFLNLPHAARKVGLHYMTLYGWARAGKRPGFRVSPKLFLVDWAEIVALVERQRVRSEDLPRRSSTDLGRAMSRRKRKGER